MAQAPNTGSTLSTSDGLNKTSTSLSTNMVIMVNGKSVGAIQEISYSESRSIKMIDEVGTDGHIDSAPNQSTEISGRCSRVRFDRLRLTEAFSRGFLHVAAQMFPFDIMILDKQKQNTGNQITTVLKNVWIKSINTKMSSSDWVIVDDMDFVAETIFSTITGGLNAAQGGEIGVDYYNNDNERLVDRGGSRGSLSASGLIDLGSSLDTTSRNGPF